MPEPTFLTLTANPALDIATSVPHLAAAHKIRCGPVRRDPGGGGVNVARVLHRLRVPVQALLLAGGPSGRAVMDLLGDEGVAARSVPIADATRENFTVRDQGTGDEYRFVLPGPQVTPGEWRAFRHAALDVVGPQAGVPPWVVASGSLPPGVPPSDFVALLGDLRACGARVALDSSGDALHEALAVPGLVDVVKPSLRELRELTGEPLADAAAWQRAARALLQQRRAGAVALSLGAQGAMLATADGDWQAQALPVKVVGTTGAGDSFLAALLAAWSAGQGAQEALRQAVAAGSAALGQAGTALCTRDDVMRLAPQVPVQRL